MGFSKLSPAWVGPHLWIPWSSGSVGLSWSPKCWLPIRFDLRLEMKSVQPLLGQASDSSRVTSRCLHLISWLWLWCQQRLADCKEGLKYLCRKRSREEIFAAWFVALCNTRRSVLLPKTFLRLACSWEARGPLRLEIWAEAALTAYVVAQRVCPHSVAAARAMWEMQSDLDRHP